MEIWLVILFLRRKKFNAKQIFMLSSSMKLGPAFRKKEKVLIIWTQVRLVKINQPNILLCSRTLYFIITGVEGPNLFPVISSSSSQAI